MKRLLFLGDSITDSGRLWLPEYKGLGDGYVKIIADFLHREEPALELINKGHDGFTLPALLRNLSIDCFSLSPDLITVLIGINDISVAINTGSPKLLQNFQDHYRMLLDRLLSESSAEIVCMGPFLFPHPQEYALWMPSVLHIQEIIASLALEYGLAFLPLHEPLNRLARELGYPAVTTDGIHLTQAGHKLIAKIWLKQYYGV